MKMRELNLPITISAFNQMIILYKRYDPKRIADIISKMETQNVKPSLLTYRLLIEAKGHSNDIMGMELVVEDMKANGIEPDIYALAAMAQNYISGGFKHKAETVLKNIEERKQQGEWRACRLLLLLYASVGKDDKVGEIWRDCELEPRIEESVAAIRAWIKLSKVEEAEVIFDVMDQKQHLTSWPYSSLLKVYVDNKLLTRGKDLVKPMGEDLHWINPFTLDSLVRAYIEVGEVEKADSVLQKACHQKKVRSLFKTHMAIMEHYAKCGDIHNTEKLFQRIKVSVYPAYGFQDRMKAHNVFPNTVFLKQLAQADPFRKTDLSDILD